MIKPPFIFEYDPEKHDIRKISENTFGIYEESDWTFEEDNESYKLVTYSYYSTNSYLSSLFEEVLKIMDRYPENVIMAKKLRTFMNEEFSLHES